MSHRALLQDSMAASIKVGAWSARCAVVVPTSMDLLGHEVVGEVVALSGPELVGDATAAVVRCRRVWFPLTRTFITSQSIGHENVVLKVGPVTKGTVPMDELHASHANWVVVGAEVTREPSYMDSILTRIIDGPPSTSAYTRFAVSSDPPSCNSGTCVELDIAGILHRPALLLTWLATAVAAAALGSVSASAASSASHGSTSPIARRAVAIVLLKVTAPKQAAVPADGAGRRAEQPEDHASSPVCCW